MGLFTKKPANKPVKEGAIASFATSKRFPVSKVLASLDEFDLGLESTAISGDWAVVQPEAIGVADPVDGAEPYTEPPDDATEPLYHQMSQSDWIRSLNRVQESPFEHVTSDETHEMGDVPSSPPSAMTSSTDLELDEDSCDPLHHWVEPLDTDANLDDDAYDYESYDNTRITLGDGEYTDDDVAVLLPNQASAEQQQTLDYLSRPSGQMSAPQELAFTPDGVQGPTLANEIDEDSFWDMMAEQPEWSESAQNTETVDGMPAAESDAIEQWTEHALQEQYAADESHDALSESPTDTDYSLESLNQATSTSDTATAAMMESLQGELDRDAWAELASPESDAPAAQPTDWSDLTDVDPDEPTIAESADVSKDFGQRIRLLMERATTQDTWVPSPEAVASVLAPAPPPPPIIMPLSQTMMNAGAVIVPQAPPKLPTTASFVIPFVAHIAPPAPAPAARVAEVTVEPEPVEDTVVESSEPPVVEEIAPPVQTPSAYIDSLPLETRQSLLDEGIEVLAGDQIAPDLQILLVTYEGTTALMADNGENAILLKTFDENPMASDDGQALGFHVEQQAVTGNRVLFTVQAGIWQGVLTLDSDEVALQLEY